MKKVLFLLLLTVSSYGQALFDKGIKVTTNINDTLANKVVVKSANNVYNYQDISKFQKEKSLLSTGLLKNGAITINGDPTKFNITPGIGIISNFDDPENPVSTIINFPAFTGVTPSYLTTGNITYIAINSTPSVVMQATPFTAIQRRDLIELGAVIHSNLTTINVVNNLSSPTNASTNQLHDLFDFIGALNLSGNVYSANGANLQLNKSAGIIGKRGVNFINNWKDPHRLSQAGETALSFRYRTQNGTEGTDRINLDPALYDLNNVLTAVPNNKFTIQTVVMFQTGLTRILYGQTIYDDLQTAINAVLTRSFVIEPNSKENGIIRSYVIMKNTTTSLQNVADVKILEAQKFGGVASGGVALTLANILTALSYTPEDIANKQNSLAVDGTNTKYPTVTAVNTGLALKANLASPTFTGVPLAPTATAGTNTTQIATTAFVTTADAGNVKLTGNQTITGIKTFNSAGNINPLIKLNATLSNNVGLDVENAGSSSTGVFLRNKAGSIGGTGFYLDSETGSTSDLMRFAKNNVSTAKIDQNGIFTSTSFINSTAPATNALLANGSTLANPISGTGTTGYFPKFTSTGVIGNSIVQEVGAEIQVSGSGKFTDLLTVSGVSQGSLDIKRGTTQAYRFFVDVNDFGIYDLIGDRTVFSIKNTTGDITIAKNLTTTQYKLSALNTAPASATATGTTGEIRITTGFIYVCTATNTWVRTALATW